MRILVHRLGSLGDTIVALPCFHVIRQVFPAEHISVLTNPPISAKAAPLESVLENMGLIDGALYYPMASRDYAKLAKLHGEIRRGRFDLYISLTFGRHIPSSLRDYAYFKTCGIRRVIGLPFARRDRACEMVGDGPLHESEALRLLRRARAIDPAIVDPIDPNEPCWTDLKLTPTELAEGRRLLDAAGVSGDYIVASVGTKWPHNEWGVGKWSELMARLGGQYPRLALVLLGSPDESARCQTLLDPWPGPKANLCGQSGPRVSSAVMRGAKLFIGHDSGPMHLAAASGTRCVAMFSALNPPGRWFPLGAGHAIFYPYGFYRRELWNDVPYQQKAIGTISVGDIFDAVQKILG